MKESPISPAATTFGKNLRKLRKEKKLTQEKLAEALNITTKHLGDLETGKSFISAPLFDSIVKYFGVSYNELFISDEQLQTIESEAIKLASRMLKRNFEEFDRKYGIELHLADVDEK